tara:strand:- start:240 stop:620 length:381 start_codon:yes stop_codon:yes gene_type:complete
MKTSHLILFLLLFWIIILFYKRREYFSHNSGHVTAGKIKLTKSSLGPLLKSKDVITNNRYQELYESGKCSSHFLPPAYARKGTDQAGNIKYCQCDQTGGVAGGLIPARNMPGFACSKDDFTRGMTT